MILSILKRITIDLLIELDLFRFKSTIYKIDRISSLAHTDAADKYAQVMLLGTLLTDLLAENYYANLEDPNKKLLISQFIDPYFNFGLSVEGGMHFATAYQLECYLSKLLVFIHDWKDSPYLYKNVISDEADEEKNSFLTDSDNASTVTPREYNASYFSNNDLTEHDVNMFINFDAFESGSSISNASTDSMEEKSQSSIQDNEVSEENVSVFSADLSGSKVPSINGIFTSRVKRAEEDFCMDDVSVDSDFSKKLLS